MALTIRMAIKDNIRDVAKANNLEIEDDDTVQDITRKWMVKNKRRRVNDPMPWRIEKMKDDEEVAAERELREKESCKKDLQEKEVFFLSLLLRMKQASFFGSPGEFLINEEREAKREERKEFAKTQTFDDPPDDYDLWELN